MLTFNSFLSLYTQLEIELNSDYLISVKNLVIMDISLDKPGFSDEIAVEVHRLQVVILSAPVLDALAG